MLVAGEQKEGYWHGKQEAAVQESEETNRGPFWIFLAKCWQASQPLQALVQSEWGQGVAELLS